MDGRFRSGAPGLGCLDQDKLLQVTFFTILTISTLPFGVRTGFSEADIEKVEKLTSIENSNRRI